jgi:regulator of replication initiation timing
MKNDSTKIAVLEANMTTIAKDILEIKADIKGIILQLNNQKALELEVSSLKKEIAEIKSANTFNKIISPTIAAVLGSVFTFLIISFLSK